MSQKLQLSAGYQLPERYSIVEVIENYRDAVSEVYFPWLNIPDGRGVSVRYEADQYLMERELHQLAQMGIKLHLLLNANCYGKNALSPEFAQNVESMLNFLTEKFSLSGITTTSLFVARLCKKKFPSLEVRASVNMNIASRQAMEYVSDYFDGFYVARSVNRDIEAVKALRIPGKKLYLLANSGCLNGCPARHFHDSLVAHEEEIALEDNAFGFGGICRDFLAGPDGPEKFFKHTNFVRPEDLNLYENYFDMIKLATRTNPDPVQVMEAYLSGCYRGNLPALLEPDHSGVLFPVILENSLLPAEFGTNRQKQDWCKICSVKT